MRTLRQYQLNGGATAAPEVDLGLHGSAQRARRSSDHRLPRLPEPPTHPPRLCTRVPTVAVGQRVTALHPRERQLFTGTVLTPDGDHYRIQFDRQKHGVQLVRDILVMPLLDGSRGIDFTSPHGMGQQIDGASPWEIMQLEAGGGREGPSPTPSSLVQADPREMQLLAYVLRLLERKRLLITELKVVCAEAEREMRRMSSQLISAVEAGEIPLCAPVDGLRPPPIRVEVTAAQQRVLGQVPPPPEVPSLGALLTQLRATSAAEVPKLERRVAIWRQEVEWLQDELRSTARALETALQALRPTAQRFSLALGAAAPEPQSRGLGMTFCAQLRDNAAERTACVISSVLSTRDDAIPAPSAPLRATLGAAVGLLMQMQTWASAPLSAAECRAGLLAALKKLSPQCDANRSKFAEVMASAQQIQSVLSGSNALHGAASLNK